MRAAKVLLPLLGWLVAFDLLGIGVCWVLGIRPIRFGSSLTFYSVWLTVGAFCGALSYISAGARISPEPGLGWLDTEHGRKTGRFVLLVTLPFLLLSSVLLYLVFWAGNPLGGYFVPDSAVPTITYFAGVSATLLLARRFLHPDPRRR